MYIKWNFGYIYKCFKQSLTILCYFYRIRNFWTFRNDYFFLKKKYRWRMVDTRNAARIKMLLPGVSLIIMRLVLICTWMFLYVYAVSFRVHVFYRPIKLARITYFFYIQKCNQTWILWVNPVNMRRSSATGGSIFRTEERIQSVAHASYISWRLIPEACDFSRCVESHYQGNVDWNMSLAEQFCDSQHSLISICGGWFFQTYHLCLKH